MKYIWISLCLLIASASIIGITMGAWWQYGTLLFAIILGIIEWKEIRRDKSIKKQQLRQSLDRYR